MIKRRTITRTVCLICAVLLAVFFIHFRYNIIMIYCVNSWKHPREIKTAWIEPFFYKMTGKNLPRNTKDVRAIFSGGRGAGMLIRYQTDQNGVENLKKAIADSDAEIKKLDPIELEIRKEHNLLLPGFFPAWWQSKSGVYLFDYRSVESGFIVEHEDYSMLIDDKKALLA